MDLCGQLFMSSCDHTKGYNPRISLCYSMIPLGSCTMKLNATTKTMPVTWPSFTDIHPFAPTEQTQGYQARGDHHHNICIIPVSAHGTNPASAAMCGMIIVSVRTDAKDNINIAELRKAAKTHKDNLSALMKLISNYILIFNLRTNNASLALLLNTIPILIVSLTVLVLRDSFAMSSIVNAVVTATCVIVYESIFCMGFGVIPNIICAQIFSTSVRGICISICALTFWISTLMVTSSFPFLLHQIGLTGVFSLFVCGCIISWVFVYMKAPETKDMPLEVIIEFFAIGAKPGADLRHFVYLVTIS
ncbi:hypothetical protein HN51_040003 [Arachis hypogaea]